MNSINYHIGLLLLRLGFSGMMLSHGIPKLMQLLQGNMEFGDPIGIGEPLSLILAVVAEVLCPLLIIFGIKTRLAAIPTIITMAVAAFIIHASDPIGKKELAILYLCAFMAIAILGPGRYSLDRK